MKNAILLLAIILSLNCNAQIPDIQWQYNYGGNSFDAVYDQKQTSDGGYILVGATNSNNIPNFHLNQEILLLKINSMGVLEWQKCIGGSLNDSGFSINIASNGDYLITGLTESSNNDFTYNQGQADFFIMRLNPNGTVLWQKTFGGSNFDFAQNVVETTEGGFVIGGTSASSNGDLTANNGNYDFWIVKINSAGVIQWQKNYGGTNDDSLYEIIKTSDGGFIMTGDTYSSSLPNYHGNSDVLVIKLNSQGDLLWQKCFGGSGSDSGSSIIETSDGNFLIGASSQSTNYDVTGNHGGFFDFWVFKITPSGTIIWQKALGGSSGDQLTQVSQATDGNYLACGASESTDGDLTINNGGRDFWVVKLSTSGTLLWQKTMGLGGNEIANTIIQTNDGGYLVAGQTANPGLTTSDLWVIKLSNESLNTNEWSYIEEKFTIFPNPVTDSFKINDSQINNVSIINVDGKVLKEFYKQETYDISELASGR